MTIKAVHFYLLLLFIPLTTNGAVVLQYHHIDNNTPASTSTSVDLIKDHIEYLINQNYIVISLPELISKIKKKELFKPNTVAITFDDAYESVYRNAFPLLRKYELPFTVFIDTAAIEEKRKNHISWHQAREMKTFGATIANHTHNHSHLIRHQESFDKWKKRVSNEINQAQEILKMRLNQNVRIFAYPYGEFDADTLTLVSELGYSAFGQHSGALDEHSNLLYLPRFPVPNRFGQFPQLIAKLQSVSFNDVSFEPMYGLLTNKGQNPPLLTIKGDNKSLKAVNCYGPDGKLIKLQSRNEAATFKATKILTTRRFRYNCTKKLDGKNKFSWISIPFVNPK
jgi:peptidoglycan/xylan/chitin deacetylase (PgdA/CDA1 family)